MCRGVFILTLLASLGVHGWLLARPQPMVIPEPPTPPATVAVLETELAALAAADEAPKTAPTPEVEPLPPAPEPRPEPEPEPEPESEPESEPRLEPPAVVQATPSAPPPAPALEAPPTDPVSPTNDSVIAALERLANAPPSEMKQGGDLSGDRDAPSSPQLRIDWGSTADAMAVMEAGAMLVVILDAGPDGVTIAQQAAPVDGRWSRAPFGVGRRFSNRMRIVDDVPAFTPLINDIGLRSAERLAVLVPRSVERLLQSAQLEAVFRSGLTMREVESVAGRFSIEGGGLLFDVTHVQHRGAALASPSGQPLGHQSDNPGTEG